MNKNKIWKIKSQKKILEEKIFDIFKLDCFLKSKNIHHDFFSIHLSEWTNVFAITQDNKAILVKQHRLGKDQVTLEVPAGAVNAREDPKNAALRELQEETGYAPEEIILLKKISVNPAIQNNNCYFFLALGCKKNGSTNFDASEELEVILRDKKEIFDSLNTNLIDNSLAFLAVLLAKDYFSKEGK